jgi:cytochrome c oxidase subunit 2
MFNQLPLFPEQASTIAEGIDLLYFFLAGVSLFFSALIFGLILYFAIRFRDRGDGRAARANIRKSLLLELAWSFIPFVIVMVVFGWGASLFFSNSRVPGDAMDIYVVGRQWMWKIQHEGGRREINELHVPVGRPVRLTLASEDVIHSFYIPAFRVKQDVVPGRFQTMWFEATRTGEYHLFCAEYCGTEHSLMAGRIIVMEPDGFQRWLEGGGDAPPAEEGRRLFSELNCGNCHGEGQTIGPDLAGLFGGEVELQSGEVLVADDDYVRRAIIDPTADITAGYQPLMPSYNGQVTEEELLQLIAFIRSEGDATAALEEEQ